MATTRKTKFLRSAPVRAAKSVSAFSKIVREDLDRQAIRVGDKFKRGERVLEVIGTKPGGKVEMLERVTAIFTDFWHRDVATWERI